MNDVLQFAPNFDDLHGFLETPAKNRLHWTAFNHTISNEEDNLEELVKKLEDEYKDEENETFDLRPYMIDQPVKCD